MPKGKTHDHIAVLSIIPTFCFGLIFFKDISLASLLTLATILTAFYLGPDIDTASSSYYRWGLLRWIWIPYRRIIAHRSILSHSFILGPLIKLIYLSFILVLLLFILFNLLDIDNYKLTLCSLKQDLEQLYPYIIAIISGILWGNAQHILTDRTVSFYKKHLSKM